MHYCDGASGLTDTLGGMSGAASSRPLATRWWRLPAAAVLAAIALVAVGPDPRALPLVYLAAVTPTLCAIDALERRPVPAATEVQVELIVRGSTGPVRQGRDRG